MPDYSTLIEYLLVRKYFTLSFYVIIKQNKKAMKRILILQVFFLFAIVSQAQPIFDLGLKGGVHFSNMDIKSGTDLVNIDSESITQTHWGAFARVGVSRVYLQPEVYFSKKGGELSSNVYDMAAGFDYGNVDVPLLLGYKVIKGSLFDLHLMAGPVFSFVTNADYPNELDPYLSEEFFNEHLWGIQYGLGVDVLFLTLDARFEHGSKIYDEPGGIEGKNTTFMISVGFKIL